MASAATSAEVQGCCGCRLPMHECRKHSPAPIRTCRQLVERDLEEVSAGALVREGLQLLAPVHVLDLNLQAGTSKAARGEAWIGGQGVVEQAVEQRPRPRHVQQLDSEAALAHQCPHLIVQRHGTSGTEEQGSRTACRSGVEGATLGHCLRMRARRRRQGGAAATAVSADLPR